MGLLRFTALAACGVLAGCDPDTGPVLRGDPDKPMVSGSDWSLKISATSGAALILHDGATEQLRIACQRTPATILIVAHAVSRRDTNRHLTLVVEPIATSFVIDQTAPADAGLFASAPLARDWARAFAAASKIGLRYSGDAVYLPAPQVRIREQFISACAKGFEA